MMLAIFVLTALCLTCDSFPWRNDLHNYMSTDELKFYFGSDKNVPDYEIVDLPENLSSGRESVFDDNGGGDNEKYVNFKVFNKSIQLHLHPNKRLMSSNARIKTRFMNGSSTVLHNEDDNDCHYLHADSESTAAISNCDSKEVHGLIFTNDDTLEIIPLSAKLKFIANLRDSFAMKNEMTVRTIPHLIKRSFFDVADFDEDFRLPSFHNKIFLNTQDEVKRLSIRNHQPLVELGLFFDEAFYKFFAPFFEYDTDKLRHFILAYINGVQSLYHHNSLSRKVDLTIVYLELMETQPLEMPHANGERNDLLDNFCHYQMSLNPKDDENPDHWDMAVYVSALDFFHWDTNGIKSGVTMGLATVGGVCHEAYNCIIAEFGSINQFGRPYPSSGFVSVYILAHEIGHNLGMSHDSVGNSCPKDGFVMSPSRGTQGETTWSSCSARVAATLDWAKCLYDRPTEPPNIDHSVHGGYPGITYKAKDQCEILIRDNDAYAFTNGALANICDNLHCRSVNKPGIFFAGPALQGTECGAGKWCEGGTCVNKKILSTTTMKPKPIWGEWKVSNCRSTCIKHGKGFQTKQRACSEPRGGCEGSSSSVAIYDDRRLCQKRKTTMEYGTQMCKEFSRIIPQIDINGHALQASYDQLRLWAPCAIFCKRKNSLGYFAPRVELNEKGISGYYPDGTFCHREGDENFYCVQNHCLPEVCWTKVELS